MAAKRKIAPPKPDPGRSWPELTKAEQSARYSAALLAYARGGGPNPGTRGEFFRQQSAPGVNPPAPPSPPSIR